MSLIFKFLKRTSSKAYCTHFFLQTIILFSLCSPFFSLELANSQNSLSDIFYANQDNNEGQTSFRSLNIPSGGRAESLGGAFTGVCDDISFFDYNPAASCIQKQTQAAVFHNSWIADSAMETLAYTTRFDNLGLGAQIKCFYVPFSEYNLYGTKLSGSYYSETSAAFNISYNFLAGYYFKGIATGLTVRNSWRSIPDYADNRTDTIIKGSGLSQSAYALMADSGIILQFNAAKFYRDQSPNLKIGFAATNIGYSMTGFGQTIIKDDPLPAKLSAGLSYKPLSFVLFSIEAKHPFNLYDLSQQFKNYYGAGCEVIITQFFSIETGFALQGANPRISLGSEFEVKKVKMSLNYTFDLTSSFNPVNHISLCAKLLLGDKGRGLKTQMAQEHYLKGLELYATGTEENVKKAVEEWKESLKYDKNFDPAKQALQVSQQIINALHDIKSYGVIN